MSQNVPSSRKAIVTEPSSTTSEKASYIPQSRKIDVYLHENTPNFIKEQNIERNPFSRGLSENAIIGLSVPRKSSGGFKNIFESEEERIWIEKSLGLETNTLNLENHAKSSYLRRKIVRLSVRKRTFDMSNPSDLLDLRILQANDKIVASKQEELRNKKSYRFYLSDQSEEIDRVTLNIGRKSQAYVLLGGMKDNFEIMRQVFIESNGGTRLPSATANPKWMLQQVNAILDKDPEKFIRIAEDPNLRIKALITTAVFHGVLKRIDGLYYSVDMKALSLPDEKNDMAGAVRFINHPENQEFKLQLMERIENAKE